MKRVVLRNFDEVISIFPALTLRQIIDLYIAVNEEIENVQSLISAKSTKYTPEELQERLEDAYKVDTFLGTYLARVCCQQNGYDWRV